MSLTRDKNNTRAESLSDGINRFDARDFAGALVCFDRLLLGHPEDKALLNYRARALERLGRFEESLADLDRSLAVDPDNLREWGNRALVLTRLSRRADALACLDWILAVRPRDVDVMLQRVVLLHQLGQRDAALQAANEAVAVAPAHRGALNMRGMVLDDVGRGADALADYEAILAVDPNHADALTNRAILHGKAGEFREALALYDRSLSIDPKQANAVYNRAAVRLVLGDWSLGFQEFESRWAIFPHEAARLTRLAPQWTGNEDVKDKTVLLHHEQGYGDTLQFCRYVPLVIARGAEVIVAVPAALRRLLQALPGSVRLVTEGEPVPTHDFHCPLMSLPKAFGTTPTTVPATIPYLRAETASVRAWGDQLGLRTKLRIGLAWSGRRYPPINTVRDITFEMIRPLLSIHADFVCLHPEISSAEREAMATTSNLTWVGNQLRDFADTAGLIMNLDLVITVDTAVAHLAGALGKPVWVMNRFASCWRWLLNRADSPWYPTLRLFRQPSLGDWASVIADVTKAAAIRVQDLRSPVLVRRSAVPAAVAGPPGCRDALQQALDPHNAGQV